MSRVALELGETSIDRAKIAPTPDGGYRMQWSMRLLNGRLIKKTTKGKCTKGELLMPKLRKFSQQAGAALLGRARRACATISAKR